MKVRLLWVTICLSTLVLGGCVGGHEALDARPRMDTVDAGPMVIAHRGYSGIAPENTEIAVALGARSGAEFIEIDVQMAADGGLVVIHDTTLTRTTNAPLLYPLRAPWNVADFTMEELQALDAGTWYGYSKDIGNFSYAGEALPDLRTILDTLRDHAGLLLEVKSPSLYPGIEAAIAAELENAGWVVDGRPIQPIIMQSFDWESMARYAAIHPDVPIGLLGKPPKDESTWDEIANYADSINPSHADIDEAAVANIHRRGFDISVYTVNEAQRMAELFAMGVDGIITDLPSRALLVRDGDTPPVGEFELAHEEITELSGMAPSTLLNGMYWGLNDSGDTPRIFAFDGRGRDLGVATVYPAVNADWEDMASYRSDGRHYLLLADVGDNDAFRPFVNLYIAREPGAPPITGEIQVDTALTVTYPDGPRDCEGVAVDAEEGFIYLLSKRDPLPRLYRVALESHPIIPVTAEFVGEISSLPLPDSGQLEPFGSITNVSPTGFAFSQDGRYALIVTLEHSYRYQRHPGQSWLEALNTEPEIIDVPDYRQIESGDFIGNGPDFLIGSEGAPAPVYSSIAG